VLHASSVTCQYVKLLIGVSSVLVFVGKAWSDVLSANTECLPRSPFKIAWQPCTAALRDQSNAIEHWERHSCLGVLCCCGCKHNVTRRTGRSTDQVGATRPSQPLIKWYCRDNCKLSLLSHLLAYLFSSGLHTRSPKLWQGRKSLAGKPVQCVAECPNLAQSRRTLPLRRRAQVEHPCCMYTAQYEVPRPDSS
jgi:hypothetical protein